MNKTILSTIVASTLFFVGCGGDTGKGKGGNYSAELPLEVKSAIAAPPSTLTQELTDTLSYMGNEERLAYDIYNNLYSQWGTKQFTNIANKSEVKHIDAMQQLIQKYKLDNQANFTNIDLVELNYVNTAIADMVAGTYDIATIQNLYDNLVAQGSVSEVEALKVGCTVEVVDVTDLDAYITIAQDSNASDVVTVFNFLRDGSYNHYWAFDKGLKNSGIVDGCCTLGATYCHPEYPQK